MARLRIIATALLVFGSLAGCGGGDDDALSKDEFVAQGNKICEDGTAELDAKADEVFGAEQPTAEDVDAFIHDSAVPNTRAQVDAIDELEAPDELADDVDDFVDAANARLDELDDMDGEELLALLASGENPFAEVNAKANAAGLTTCGAD